MRRSNPSSLRLAEVESCAPPNPTSVCSRAFETLSEREREVLELLARGAMDKEITRQLSIRMDAVR